jgi:signal transduction histidine kinase
LRRILDNLVGNALDAVNGGGGEVQLSAVRVENMEIDRVRFVVKDNGPGMSSEELRKVFDDFYTTKPGGTGLGLSVVRRLVADHGGTLRVETEPGRGTRMIVELPAVGTATRHGAAEGGAA